MRQTISAWRLHWDEPDEILTRLPTTPRYRSRHENATLNLCLFLDRCGDALTIGSSVQLDQIDRAELLRMVVPYGIILDW